MHSFGYVCSAAQVQTRSADPQKTRGNRCPARMPDCNAHLGAVRCHWLNVLNKHVPVLYRLELHVDHQQPTPARGNKRIRRFTARVDNAARCGRPITGAHGIICTGRGRGRSKALAPSDVAFPIRIFSLAARACRPRAPPGTLVLRPRPCPCYDACQIAIAGLIGAR